MSNSSRGFALVVPLILVLFAVGIVGYFAYQSGLIDTPFTSTKTGTQPIPTTDPTSDQVPDGDLAGWKTYRNEEYGFEFKYPEKLTLLEENSSTKLSHSIPYKHQSPCAMVGNEPPIDGVTDFSLTIEISQKGLGETVAQRSRYIKDEGYIEKNSLKLDPGFIDKYEVGALKGYKITSGAECGIYEYLFPIDENHTLIATRSWEVTTIYGGMPEVLNLPGLISDDQSEQYFIQILSTFKFLP